METKELVCLAKRIVMRHMLTTGNRSGLIVDMIDRAAPHIVERSKDEWSEEFTVLHQVVYKWMYEGRAITEEVIDEARAEVGRWTNPSR